MENNYENAYNYICRVCLSYKDGEKFVPLIENTSDKRLTCYGKAVTSFANISIEKNDNLPSYMCQNCLLLLKHAIYFKLKCESSDKRLKQMSKKIVNNEFHGENIKEIIVQYSMFTQYFSTESNGESSRNESSDKTEEKPGEIVTESNDDFDLHFGDENSKDSDDEILDALEKMPDTFPILQNIYHKRPIKNKLLKRSKMHINKLKLIKKRLQARKRIDKNRIEKSEKLMCNICNRLLANQLTFDHHMQRHNGCRYICEHCGKGFPVLLELHMHQVARHGTGPFLQCQHCTYKAPRKLNLIEHERLHTGERPYTCDKCGLTFRRRAIWRKHMIYHTEKTVQCLQCPRKFFRRSEMLAHANSMHERMYVYLCHKCDATYAKTETVRRHLTERHGIPREMQGKIVRINKGRGTSFPEQ
ncbi:uncharacterized protein ACR2FA_010774 [Aphomia sociella]